MFPKVAVFGITNNKAAVISPKAIKRLYVSEYPKKCQANCIAESFVESYIKSPVENWPG
ncbi:hypothetical protein PMEGAPL125_00600 [Priestia megaterium]